MKREYIQKNVYEAVQERFDFLFREFENIYVSFSGGKDNEKRYKMKSYLQKD